jgi:Uma2 family endonuclease
MAEPQRRRMTPDEFFEWQKRQDRNYELVDGIPVLPLKPMTGATHRHDRVVTNALISLGQQLRGGPCWSKTADIAVRIPRGNVRRPDLTVECGNPADTAMDAAEPRVVIEVLSPSTMNYDRVRNLEEYKTVESLSAILLADTESSRVTAYARDGGGWTQAEHAGLEAVISLPAIRAALPLAALYDRIAF